ncbi:hypothetical protein [Streptomyces sp. NPDC001315]|uniref:hypothetical protein n=1 Tax=Streptomyces sp. NPDC001315 TaxID=3364562 RepID=UPI0036B4636B
MTGITYTGVLAVGTATAETLAKLLADHRGRLGTRKTTHALAPFEQGVSVLRRFLDGTRMAQLTRNNHVSLPTASRYLHEGQNVLAEHAPDLPTALEHGRTT